MDSLARSSRMPGWWPWPAERRGDVGGDLADRLVADHRGVGQGLVHDGLNCGDARVLRHKIGGRCGAVVGALDVAGLVAGHLHGPGVDGQLDLADELAVVAGLDDRAGLARRLATASRTGASHAYCLWVWPVKIAPPRATFR